MKKDIPVSTTSTSDLHAGKPLLYVVKIGGNIIDDAGKLDQFLTAFSALKAKKVLVHGGGKLATDLANKLGITQALIEGRRITDRETLEVVTMVYAGLINKNIVARLQSLHCNAMGLTGADGNLISATKRKTATIDYGFVGDITSVNAALLTKLAEQDITTVIAPITHDGEGQLLNTNADTIAQETAKTLGQSFEVTLIYSFEKNGVLLDVSDDSTVINKLSKTHYEDLKEQHLIFAGMIPKLDNAFSALENSVSKVVIGNAQHLDQLVKGTAGTTISIS